MRPQGPDSWNDFRKWWNSHHAPEDWKDLKGDLVDHAVFSLVMENTNSFVSVVDMRKMEYLYFNGHVKEFTGWDEEKFTEGGVEFAHTLYHPDDIQGIVLFSEQMNKYYESLSDRDRPHYKAYIDYRVKRPDDTYQRILQQATVLKEDKQGSIAVLILFLSRITNHKGEKNMHLRLTKGKESKLYEFNGGTKKMTELECLSDRELEVFSYISRGYDRTSVAEKLSITLSTVKTHCHNVYGKLKLNDSIETISLLKLYGFL